MDDRPQLFHNLSLPSQLICQYRRCQIILLGDRGISSAVSCLKSTSAGSTGSPWSLSYRLLFYIRNMQKTYNIIIMPLVEITRQKLQCITALCSVPNYTAWCLEARGCEHHAHSCYLAVKNLWSDERIKPKKLSLCFGYYFS